MNGPLDSLTDFTLLPEYHRDRTLYHVHAKTAGGAVALLRSDDIYDSGRPLQVLTGPGLDQPAGWVSWSGAKNADGTVLGKVSRKRGVVRKDAWIFAQHGLPELQGERPGVVGAMRETLPARMVLGEGLKDTALSLRLRFSAPGCDGFEFTRPPGLRAKYRVRVRDERISRLLAIACVIHYNVWEDADPRKDIIDATTNPFKHGIKY